MIFFLGELNIFKVKLWLKLNVSCELDQNTIVCKYLGLNISQFNSKVTIDQVNYIKSVDYIATLSERKKTTKRWLAA